MSVPMEVSKYVLTEVGLSADDVASLQPRATSSSRSSNESPSRSRRTRRRPPRRTSVPSPAVSFSGVHFFFGKLSVRRAFTSSARKLTVR